MKDILEFFKIGAKNNKIFLLAFVFVFVLFFINLYFSIIEKDYDSLGYHFAILILDFFIIYLLGILHANNRLLNKLYTFYKIKSEEEEK